MVDGEEKESLRSLTRTQLAMFIYGTLLCTKICWGKLEKWI